MANKLVFNPLTGKFDYVTVIPPVAASNYEYVQSTPSSVWTIVHNLGFYPGGINIVDSSGRMVEGDEEYIDINTIKLTFDSSFSGVAYLS